jgi:MoxR-like ATPase
MRVAEAFQKTAAEFHKVVVGQDEVLRLMLVAYLSRGHILFEGVPGLAKTLMVKTLSVILGSGIDVGKAESFRRIQFTPDMLPSDILGTMVYSSQEGKFRLHRGPLFCHFLLADEINRTPPKTQSALLEAMEERQVTIEGGMEALPVDFTVFATQNPIEYEGTYPLPEAQLDRFMMRVKVGYPSRESEKEVLMRYHQGFDAQDIASAGLVDLGISAAFTELTAETIAVKVKDEVLDYILDIVQRTRQKRGIVLGASPRAGIHLLRGAKVLATMEGRDFVTPDDVAMLVQHVLNHRLILSPELEIEGRKAEEIISEILKSVPVPR